MDSGFPHHEETFMEKYFWVMPLVIAIIGFTFTAIVMYCAYKHRQTCLPYGWRRQPGVVIVQNNPGGSTAHIISNYPPGTVMNVQYPPMNSYPNVPPPYSPPQNPTTMQKEV